MESILSIALTFFLVTNPVGNSPAILALVKNFDFEKQKKIMFREAIFALLIALFFQYLGEPFLNLLNIQKFAVTLCGGTLLFLVALQMIFTLPETDETASLQQEPFFVPIATPLLSGPGLLTIIMLKSQLEQNQLYITLSILIAWIGVTAVMVMAPYLQKILGKRGMVALEQFMGLILAMIAMQMIVKGAELFREYLTLG